MNKNNEKLKQFIEQNKDKIYEIAKRNTKYNSEGKAVISTDDEWFNDDAWDELYKDITKNTQFDENNVVEAIITPQRGY